MSVTGTKRDLRASEKRVLFTIILVSRGLTGILSRQWERMGNAQLLSLALSLALSVAAAYMVWRVCSFCDKPFLEAVEHLAGPIVSKAMCVLLMLMVLISARTVLYAQTATVVALTLIESRILYVAIAAVAAALAVSMLGIAAPARFARLMVYMIAISVVAVLALAFGKLYPRHLLPIAGYGAGYTAYFGLCGSADYFALIMLGQYYDTKAGKKENLRIMLGTVITAGAICALLFAINVMVFPYTHTQVAPLFEIVSVISTGNYLQGLASLFIFVWNTAFLLTICAQFCMFGELSQRLVPRLRTHRYGAAVCAALTLLLAVADKKSFPAALSPLIETPMYTALIIYLPVVALFVATLIRQRRNAA